MLNSQDVKDIIKAELKKDKSKSVKDMCQVCEVNKNILSTMASGSMPTLENIARIADYLGVSVDYLLGRQIFPLLSYHHPYAIIFVQVYKYHAKRE